MNRFACLPLLILLASDVAPAQSTSSQARTPYRVEWHFEGGPLFSIFGLHYFPGDARKEAFGSAAMTRVMWHPDHFLSVGLLMGYESLIAEGYDADDPDWRGPVRAALHAYPLMIDESMSAYGFEVGVALGGSIVTTSITDNASAFAMRFELGTIAHAAYRWHIDDRLSVGIELVGFYLSYRGILSFAPQLQFNYDLLKY